MSTILDDRETTAPEPRPRGDPNEVNLSEELARALTKESQKQASDHDGHVRYPDEAHIARRDYQTVKDQEPASGATTPLPFSAIFVGFNPRFWGSDALEPSDR